MREFDKTDARNVLESLRRRAANRLGPGRDRPGDAGPLPTEHMGGELEGVFQFTLINDDGSVERVQTHNSLVDEGRNALLQFIGDITDSVSAYTFSGDGSQTTFQLPYPYKPVESFDSVTVDGNSQTEGSDFWADYSTGEITFFSAPSSGTDNVSVDASYHTHPWRWLAVGTDGSSVSDSQTSLGSESTRVDLDSSYNQDTGTVEISGVWTFGNGQANVDIAEAGLFNVPASAPTNGEMFNRTVVSPVISKSSSQSLQVTWTLSMS